MLMRNDSFLSRGEMIFSVTRVDKMKNSCDWKATDDEGFPMQLIRTRPRNVFVNMKLPQSNASQPLTDLWQIIGPDPISRLLGYLPVSRLFKLKTVSREFKKQCQKALQQKRTITRDDYQNFTRILAFSKL
eukprot:TRINITY_DN14854_c0_g1_i1.p1 TRINITY_DN14854_c0_g1~~TRINITY_DN14854_c0_g1_i1.p1  ORF type:complete len:131 (-),score=12.93 TRINITY_DN14854_c0_g1_i1:199-591(-)